MKWLKYLFAAQSQSREERIAGTSLLCILLNVLVAVVKVGIGVAASSIAIISEGINNATDALTSVLALVGAKLAKKRPDAKHPFGYGRIEYLASLAIAVLILVTGFEVLISSVKSIFTPEPLSVSYLSLAIVALSAVLKFFLGIHTIKVGKGADSSSLVGVGTECRNDSFASVITLASAIFFLITKISVDGYAGILISALILKAGFDVLKETLTDLLGRPGEKELATQLYREIRSTKGVLAAADMMLHNYGPDAWSGSVNVEMDANMRVGEIYAILHELQLNIMHTHKVTMVFGVYAVDNDNEKIKAIRKTIGAFVKQQAHVKSFHAVYLDEKESRLYCDFMVDYAQKDYEALEETFKQYMQQEYPAYSIELTVETDFV